MKKQRQGISLIVLVITIIVMIILASAIIITLSNTNIITKAREAVLKTDVKNFEQELSLAFADKKLKDNTFDLNTVNATTLAEIAEYIPSFDEKYLGKIFIQNGEVVYDESKVTEDEKEALEEVGIKTGKIYTPSEIKAIIESKNLANTVSTTDITPYVEGLSKTDAVKYTIFKGDLFYRYEKTTYEEQLELHAAEICILLGDANEDGILTLEDGQILAEVEVEGKIPNLHRNFVYICDLNSDLDWGSSDEFVVSSIAIDNENTEYDAQDMLLSYVSIENQNPDRIRFIGDYLLHSLLAIYKYPDVITPSDLNTTDYEVMKEYYPDMTEEQGAKFAIVDGVIMYKESVLTEEEISWADEAGIPYV